MERTRPPELRLPRWVYHRLIAARTGHDNFKGYHERSGHEDIDWSCVCGRERRPWHFAECRLALQNWRNVKRVRPPGGREMLAENGWEEFYQYVTVSGCYSVVLVSRGDWVSSRKKILINVFFVKRCRPGAGRRDLDISFELVIFFSFINFMAFKSFT